jgi:hypothetical protein
MGSTAWSPRGLDRSQARWVSQVVEEVASAPDPEILELKDGGS